MIAPAGDVGFGKNCRSDARRAVEVATLNHGVLGLSGVGARFSRYDRHIRQSRGLRHNLTKRQSFSRSSSIVTTDTAGIAVSVGASSP